MFTKEMLQILSVGFVDIITFFSVTEYQLNSERNITCFALFINTYFYLFINIISFIYTSTFINMCISLWGILKLKDIIQVYIIWVKHKKYVTKKCYCTYNVNNILIFRFKNILSI